MKAYEDNPTSIKFYVKRYILKHAQKLKGKVVFDFPAGSGVTSRILKEVGAIPKPFDLFPEYFKVDGLICERADVTKGVPIADHSADYVISQEGIEHFSDQLQCLQEFNRVLKSEGILLITTPNYSNMRSRLSYFLSESERYAKMMPPNELDSVWMSHNAKVYYGHLFLIGIQKLRTLARLSGFKLKKVHFNRVKYSSLLWCILFYPFIFTANFLAYRKSIKNSSEFSREIYREIFLLGISPKILVDSHLFVEFVKEKELAEIDGFFSNLHRDFNTKT